MASDSACNCCSNFCYDEETESYECVVPMDEDDMYNCMSENHKECPFFSLDDEYKIVRKQM